MVKKIAYGLLISITLLMIILVSRTIFVSSILEEYDAVDVIELEEDRIIDRFSKGIKIPTISNSNPADMDSAEFYRFIDFTQETYPEVFEILEFELINDLGMLFRWAGDNASDQKPILLMAHYDVVPIDEATRHQWKHPPFSGHVDDEFVWGRGSIDDKSGVFSILEAISYLLGENFQPNRDIYVAFGHDEEIGGLNGAYYIGQHLSNKGVELEFVVDEGLPIIMELTRGFETPVAFIGVSEKGNMYLELSVEKRGGHSSLPESETAITILTSAIEKLRANPIEGRLDGLGQVTLEAMVTELPIYLQIPFSNLWLFRAPLERKLKSIPATNAIISTTEAVTIFQAGVKENVLPSNARAVINYRIHPRDSMESVISHVAKTINDPRIKLNPIPGSRNPAAISDFESEAYRLLNQSIQEIFPDVATSPSIFLAGTDSRHYRHISENIFRFRPFRATEEDAARVHGVNERINIENFMEMIRFQVQLITNAAQAND